MPNYKSGKDGSITLGASDLACVRNWSLNLSANLPSFATSCSPGFKARVKGVQDASVNFDIVVDFDDEIWDRIKPGDSVTLILNIDGGSNFSVPCLIESLGDITVDVDDGTEVSCPVAAQSNGAWTYPGGTVAT